MGRLPDTFANKKIFYRQPWAMPGQIRLTTGQLNVLYPDATFQNATDKPFEIHRMIPRALALDSNGVPLPTQPDMDFLLMMVLLTIQDLTKTTQLIKSPAVISSLTKGSSERTWEWAEPYYLVKSEQLQVSASSITYPAIQNLNAIQLNLTFEGFFVVVTPPSENR